MSLTDDSLLYALALLLPLPLPWLEDSAEGVEAALAVRGRRVGVQGRRLGLAILAHICPRHTTKPFFTHRQHRRRGSRRSESADAAAATGTAVVVLDVLHIIFGPHGALRVLRTKKV